MNLILYEATNANLDISGTAGFAHILSQITNALTLYHTTPSVRGSDQKVSSNYNFPKTLTSIHIPNQ